MFKKKSFKTSFITVLLISVTILSAWALQHHVFFTPAAKVVAKDTSYTPPAYDGRTLADFQRLCRRYDTIRRNYTISGQISVTDRADTSMKMDRVPFICCKKGDELYYQLGKTETINAAGVYLYIDHQAHTVLLSAQKEIQSENPGTQAIQGLQAGLQSEDYQLSIKTSAGQQSYSLVNEHHISCKEYTLTVDTGSQRLTRIFTRLSGPEDPLRTDNEKLIDIRIERWQANAGFQKHTSAASIVRREGKLWKLTKNFENYQLISM